MGNNGRTMADIILDLGRVIERQEKNIAELKKWQAGGNLPDLSDFIITLEAHLNITLAAYLEKTELYAENEALRKTHETLWDRIIP